MKTIMRKSTARWFYKANGDPSIQINERALMRNAMQRIPSPHSDRVATSAAELFAAAHAICFNLALSSELGERKSASGRVNTTTTITLEHWVSGWTVTNIRLDILARLPHMTHCDFVDATVRAKTSCFISRLTKTNITMNAKLQR